ncbi:hypothetical protein OG552_09755 [Streptomyces sp. NBC_01476]|uniref:hypothetical protein n=1 Tax=Streptomyces sp. NBC_01476 TaxID=2903881 RepID=UPI002E372398|nr:hypothetical protein [Streptomyces sp. NBC_01476]
MQIHRSRQARGFTVLPNALLQDRRLSYTARGLLVDLLSRPHGWSEDGRRMADSSPQGRLTVAKALRELAAFGYYRVDKVRRADGTFLSETHVYDLPQQPPDLTHPGSGAARTDRRGANPVKSRWKGPTLPAQPPSLPEATDDRPPARKGGRGNKVSIRTDTSSPSTPPDGQVSEAVALLYRVIRPEPRLRLGTAEALALAPLVATWLERGYGQRDLAEALLGGLPTPVHSAPALLRDRLTRKLPPAPEPVGPAAPPWSECGECARPIPHEGICRTCAGLGDSPPGTGEQVRTAARGRAKVRAALVGRGQLDLARA